MLVVVWRLADHDCRGWDLFDLSDRHRERGWLVLAYRYPKGTIVMRIVVRNGVSLDLASLLLDDIREAVGYSTGSRCRCRARIATP
ncbi:hypothetical protein ABN034_31845 [Actinopolymorpha sp. B11F2]|uniref:hypothetical protein n=1 Tax=Actinopolymorpha sp. B11F2 TaxID=3160862 RepID=UPI0032E36F5A